MVLDKEELSEGTVTVGQIDRQLLMLDWKGQWYLSSPIPPRDAVTYRMIDRPPLGGISPVTGDLLDAALVAGVVVIKV